MLLTVDIENKTIGNKELFRNLQFTIEPRQKIGIIGRNGVGKTTLFALLTGQDTDYNGTIRRKAGVSLMSTAQEHHAVGRQTVVEYVLANLPEYERLKRIIDTYPATMGSDLKKIEAYSNTLERFTELDYFRVEDEIVRQLEKYQITPAMAGSPLQQLSGGQKRFVELVRIECSQADVVLIDEPTNHMDYVAKEAFIDWLKAAGEAVLVITHDRDVLQGVDRIIEIKDGTALTFKGNYEAYLAQNATSTASKIHDYEVAQQTLANLHKKIMWARARKPSWHGTADQRNPFVVMERRLQKEYDEIQSAAAKPNFWIDRESAKTLRPAVGDSYQKYKAKNINIRQTSADKHASSLLEVDDLSLGYGQRPLFAGLTFGLQHGQKLRIIGRNGAGKTTLVKAIAAAGHDAPTETLLHGNIRCNSKLRLSIYEQELESSLMELTLAAAIEHIYDGLGLPVSNEAVQRAMGDYLFDPYQDGKLLVGQLSGGQKARLQIIKLLANNPNLLILDEPTNHLDLPSIEELETALLNYQGAILYITHDSYFANTIGGEELTLAR
jgi:ATP-binding cassette, subfamily F, member 3